MTRKKKIPDDDVRWGIIGVGDVCEVKSAPAMQLVENSSLVAVMRRNAQKAKDYAQRHSVPRWYDQAEKLINDKDVNAIYIATPPGSHFELTLLAAKAGKPIYVEKPMALNYQQCVKMNDFCHSQGVPLYVAYYRRALPNFLKVKEILDKNEIGDVRAVEIKLTQSIDPKVIAKSDENWRVDPEISGGGYFVDLASHQFDLLDFLFGPITLAQGIIRNQAGLYAAEDIVAANWEFDTGILGSGLWCFTTAKVAEEEQIKIIGSKGQISFECFGQPEVRLKTDAFGEEVYNFIYPKHIQQPLIQGIVEDLLGKGNSTSSGVSASRANKVLDAILKR